MKYEGSVSTHEGIMLGLVKGWNLENPNVPLEFHVSDTIKAAHTRTVTALAMATDPDASTFTFTCGVGRSRSRHYENKTCDIIFWRFGRLRLV